MKSELAASAQEVLAGLVERVTFHNPDAGFCVLRVKARGQRDLVTVIGHAATISAGGRWPDGSRPDRANVLIWSGEDDVKDTLIPRLIAAGADRSRIHQMNGASRSSIDSESSS